jgi:predicted ATP-dependent protease
LLALLSSLSGVPINQRYAVTGSVNQRGEVQAIGGVNEKIEGFFAVCSARGLVEGQGVVIPAANIEHLMLRTEVVNATPARFKVHAVRNVDEALAIVTGREAGERNKQGKFPAGSVNYQVEQQLLEFSRLRKGFLRSTRTQSRRKR